MHLDQILRILAVGVSLQTVFTLQELLTEEKNGFQP